MSSTTIFFSLEESEGSIPDRFEKVVCRVPNHLAVKTPTNSYTYQALNEQANRVARILIKAGGKTGDSVALLLDFGADIVAAILGVLKAGMVYIVLDPALPAVRLQSILEHARAGYILSDSQDLPLAGKINPKGKPAINLDALDRDGNKANLELQMEPSSPAAIYYTSGTTGEPKGIVRNHRDILYRGWIYSDLYKVSPDDTISQVFSFSFAASTSDMFGSLLNGATLCLYNIRKSTPLMTVEWLVGEGITIFHPPVAFFRQLLDNLTGDVKFPRLRMIQLGGAPLFKRDVERSRMFFPPTCILNNRFATTEVGLIASFMIDHETRLLGEMVPIGYPVAGMDVFLVDEAGKLVGPNEVGEIAVRSRYLSPGYWHDPEHTKERFGLIAPDGQGVLYLTGDLGRADFDGCLEHLGRKDSVVKVRGYRVDTNEVELALRENPDIKDVFVTIRPVPHAPLENRIITYIVQAQDKPVTVHTLRDFLAKRLPRYMLPARFIFLDALPLNPNGKVDQHALPDPSRENNESYCPPRSAIEKRLVGIWMQEFNLERIGVKDDFFELGGDSLLAVEIQAGIERHFGLRLPLTFIVDHPTVEHMAKYVEESATSHTNHSIVAIRPEGSKPILYIFPGNSGRILYYYHRLADLLGSDQPVYGIEMMQTGQATPSTWLEETAQRYMREIREFQPSGPYYLSGYSFGGLVAYEVAVQLIAAGEKVAFVGLLNSHLAVSSTPQKLNLFQRVNKHMANLQGLSAKDRSRYFAARIRDRTDNLERYRFLRSVFKLFRLDPNDVSQINSIASRTYQPRFYPGKVTLFRAMDEIAPKYVERYESWKKIVAELEVHDIPGTHGTILDETHVNSLAAVFKQCLEEARAVAMVELGNQK